MSQLMTNRGCVCIGVCVKTGSAVFICPEWTNPESGACVCLFERMSVRGQELLHHEGACHSLCIWVFFVYWCMCACLSPWPFALVWPNAAWSNHFASLCFGAFSLTNRSCWTATCTPRHKNRLLLYLCCRLFVSSLAYVYCQRNVQQRAAFKAALCFKCCSNLRVKIQNSHMKDYNQGQWWKQKKIDGECPNLKESVLNVATFKFRVLWNCNL